MAVRTPTDAASRARSLAVAAAVPQNMHVAAFYASLEWWRVKALALEESKDAFSVLSLSNGSPDYDREVSNLLKSRRPNLRCVAMLVACRDCVRVCVEFPVLLRCAWVVV